MLERWKEWVRAIKRDLYALYLAARDPRVPWYAKALALAVAAYAASPIDLIPDFIPVFGYLDELFILPLGIALAIKLVPPDILAEHRQAAAQAPPVSKGAAVVIAALWCLFLGLLGWSAYRYFYR